MKTNPTVLIVGATGATGKHLVQSLLNDGYPVSVVVRSKERLLSLIDTEKVENDLLTVKEAPSFNDLSDAEYNELVEQADVLVSCLGHTLNLSGIWGRADRRLVTDTVKRLTAAAKDNKKKFILMSSDGVVGPKDDLRPFSERAILAFFRYVFTPHVDNEEAAAYLQSQFPPTQDGIKWVIARPTNLVEDATSDYQVHNKPVGSLFGDTKIARSLVAKFMKDLISNPQLWERYAFQMPVLENAPTKEVPSKE
jgi:nucleoside-diphosphate-sugar epimerase